MRIQTYYDETPDGKTNYQVDIYRQEGKEPIAVMRTAPNNEGQPFGQDEEQRDGATVKVADRLDKEKTSPKNQEIYQERTDGIGFDKVTFKPEEINGDLVWQEQREYVSPQQFAERLSSYDQEPSYKKDALSKEELTQFQEQVDQHHEQLAERGELTAGINDIEKETASQTQQEQQEISRNDEITRQQGISR